MTPPRRVARILVALGVAFALSATLAARGPRSLTITIHSDPEGAMLYANESRQQIGYTLFMLKYQPSKEFKAGKACFHTQSVMVRWASGVEASMSGLDACPQNGANQQITFVRPDLPGRGVDVAFALELQRLAIQRAAVMPPAPVYVPPPAPRFCTSNVIGNQVFTTCY